VKLNQTVTSHGFALNLTTDLDIFNTGIVPCGLVGKRATSVLALGGPSVEVAAAGRSYLPCFADTFAVSVEAADPAELASLRAPATPAFRESKLPVI
jgi:lipoate-protein ligase B